MRCVKKAVIACGGRGTRFLPATRAIAKEMLPLVDRPCLEFIVDELVESGIESILVVINSDKEEICKYYSRNEGLIGFMRERGALNAQCFPREDVEISFVYQSEARGNADALALSREFCGSQPFVVCWGDDIIFSKTPVARQLVERYEQLGECIVGCQYLEGGDITKYGVIMPRKGESFLDGVDCVGIDAIVEKPPIEQVPSKVIALGRFVLTPDIFEYIDRTTLSANGEYLFTDTINMLAKDRAVYAAIFSGKRYDIGDKVGALTATIDYALRRDDLKDELIEYLFSLKI